jgi:nucleoside-diphosphate-sugar epimerase
VPDALVIGGTGLIGRAVARRLLPAGWQVTVTGRDPHRTPTDLAAAGARFAPADRDNAATLATAAAAGCDLLVDCICYTAAQARLLLPLARNAGSTVMISSKAVYVDDAGNHSNSPTPPQFHAPLTEQQPTMQPGDMPYNSPHGYGANKVAAEQVLLDSGLPVTVHGAGRLGVSDAPR